MKSRHFRLLFGLLLFSAAVIFSGPVPAADEGIWSVIKISAIPVGYEMETRTEASDGGVLTVSESKIVLNRLGNKVELVTLSRTEEDPNGRLRRAETELRASTMSTRSVTVVKPGNLEIESEAGGKKYFRTAPYVGELLGPEGIRRLTIRTLHSPGEQIEYQTLSAESGTVTKGRRRAVAREVVPLEGRDVATLKIEETIEASGLAGFVWLDENGDAVKGEMPTPFGLAEILRADRETALASAAGGDLPAEMYERSMIKSNVRLSRARALEMLRVKLTLRHPRDEWPNLGRPGQMVVSRTGSDLLLEIRRLPAPVPVRLPVAETEANREFLRPNEYIQSDLPEIRETARSVVNGESDVLGAALKLERWVADNMTFDLGIALAPASELIKNKRGTCLGYATLLATLARAAGIPSRIVLGYVYALGMFGGHAWTEIQIGEDWVPLDAAVVSAGIADPARIGFAASSLQDGPMSLTAGTAAQLFGGTEIKIAAFRLDGRTTEVPETAEAFRTEGDVYINPGLGLTWTRPPGFVFSGTGAVWPDPTVVVCEGGDAGRITFQEMTVPPWKDFFTAAGEVFSRRKLSGLIRKTERSPLSGLRMDGSGRAAAVFDNAPDAWIFIAEGRDAAAVLTRALEGLRPAAR
jgi:hypothetical protein